jgi:hypothetical protein
LNWKNCFMHLCSWPFSGLVFDIQGKPLFNTCSWHLSKQIWCLCFGLTLAWFPRISLWKSFLKLCQIRTASRPYVHKLLLTIISCFEVTHLHQIIQLITIYIFHINGLTPCGLVWLESSTKQVVMVSQWLAISGPNQFKVKTLTTWYSNTNQQVARWFGRVTRELEVAGSNPATSLFLLFWFQLLTNDPSAPQLSIMTLSWIQ